MDQRIADYIRDHRGTYTREALTQQLLDAGYTREAIDATWAALDTPDPDDTAGEGFWGRFFLILVGINVAVIVLVGLGTGSLFAPERIGLLAILAVALAIGALIAWGIVALVGPTRMGRTTATVIGIVIPLVFALLIGGSCYALLSAFGPPPRAGTMDLQTDTQGLSGSGDATCFLYSTDTFSMFGQLPGSPYTTVSVNADSAVAGGVAVSVSLEPTSETEPSQSWSTYAGDHEISADITGGGLAGTVTFTDLQSDLSGPEFEGSAPDPISGTITWNCD
jgi:hypothetical protein